jgi:hypothetical protein
MAHQAAKNGRHPQVRGGFGVVGVMGESGEQSGGISVGVPRAGNKKGLHRCKP